MSQHHKGFYPTNWEEIAQRVKDEANWHCIRCGHPHDPQCGYTLTVHHLDCNKSNCAWWNLVALCQRCHLRIQAKVVMARTWMFEHTDWIKPHVAGYYAHIFDFPTDRAFVEMSIDTLIHMGQGRLSAVQQHAFRGAADRWREMQGATA